MNKRALVYVALGVIGVVALFVVGDLLVTTDEERIAPLIDAVTGEVSGARIDAALAWTDPTRQPVEVEALGRTELFEDRETLSARAHDALRRFQGDTLRILGESIEVDGERATVSLRLLSGQSGMTNVHFDLAKRDDRWLIAKVSVQR